MLLDLLGEAVVVGAKKDTKRNVPFWRFWGIHNYETSLFLSTGKDAGRVPSPFGLLCFLDDSQPGLVSSVVWWLGGGFSICPLETILGGSQSSP